MIDLYDDATFEGGQLDELERTLLAIAEEARSKPEDWEVCVGYNVGSALHPVPATPIYRPVLRQRLLELVADLLRLVTEAKSRGTHVRCMGD